MIGARETKTAGLLLALAVVATMAVPALGSGAHVPQVKIEATNGGGFINSTVMPNQSTFGFMAINTTNSVMGQLEYVDHGAMIKLHGNVTMLSVNKTAKTATFSGMARATNATGAKSIVPYTVNVMAGKKGVGIFNMTIPAIPDFLPTGYTDNGTLLGGNIK